MDDPRPLDAIRKSGVGLKHSGYGENDVRMKPLKKSNGHKSRLQCV